MFDGPWMNVIGWLIGVWATCTSVIWLLVAARIARGTSHLRCLRDQPAGQRDTWPRLSILIAACNEADTLPDAMTTLLKQDYPNLEIVLVNDRSSDETGAIIDGLAADDPRVVAAHVETLPDGWLGKVHALSQARRHATGDWLLFTDADVHFAPDALRRAVNFAEDRQLDHLAVIPEVEAEGFWLRTTMSAGVLPTLAKLPIQNVGRDHSDTVIGAGAFNLVRACKLDETEGLKAIRLEIADDYALAWLVKQAGARTAVLSGIGQVGLTWYPSLAALLGRMDKSFYAMRFSYARLGLAVLLAGWFILGPLVGVALAPHWAVRIIAAAGYFALALAGVRSARKMGWPAWYCLLLPVGLGIMTWGLVRAGINCWRRGGLLWRGTLYPKDQLRDAQRVRF